MEEINLPIPFTSQWDTEANEDATDQCGPACVSMLLAYFGVEDITPNQVFERTGAFKGELITIPQLEKAIASYGYTCEFKPGCRTEDIIALLKQGVAPIVLVHYENLSSREDQKYKGPHFIIIDGMRSDTVFANDPDFFAQFRADGDHHAYTMTDFLAAWGNCHLDNNPDNSLLIIYPNKQETVPAQTATIEAAVDTSTQEIPVATQPSLQDEYDHIQHLLLDLATFAGAASIGDRDAMVEQAKTNIQKLKDVEAKDTQTLLDLKTEGGKKDDTILSLMAEIDTLKRQKQVLADQISEMEKDDSYAVVIGRNAVGQLNDMKSGQDNVAALVKPKKKSWTQITWAIESMRNGYEATIIELKKQLERQKTQPEIAESSKEQQTKPRTGYFDVFKW